jgi:hypothetical protein
MGFENLQINPPTPHGPLKPVCEGDRGHWGEGFPGGEPQGRGHVRGGARQVTRDPDVLLEVGHRVERGITVQWSQKKTITVPTSLLELAREKRDKQLKLVVFVWIGPPDEVPRKDVEGGGT